MKSKMKAYEIVLWVFVLIVIVIGLAMPKTGTLVMVDEFCDVIVVWSVCIYVAAKIVLSRGRFSASIRAIRILAVAACVVFGILFAASPVLDLVSGPETSRLTDIQVSMSEAHTGIFSLHYYLTGIDSQGESVRLEISGDDYTRLSGSSSVTVEYYRHTGRLIRYM